MRFWQGLWAGVVRVSKQVLAVFSRALSSFVAQEAAGYYTAILALVREAEARGGTGQQKYDWVVNTFKNRMAAQFQQTPQRALDFAIHMAVAEISRPQP